MAQGGKEKEDEKERLSIKFIEHLSQRHKDEEDEEDEEDEDFMNLRPSHHWNFIKAVNVSEKLQYYLSTKLSY